MLRFRRDRVFVGIAPDGISHVRFTGTFSASISDYGLHPLDGRGSPADIPEAFAALCASPVFANADLYITLADRLGRHFVSERPKGARSPREIALTASARFEDVFGTGSAEWDIRVDIQPLAVRQLACAFPKSLLDGIVQSCSRTSGKLRSLRPFSVSELCRQAPPLPRQSIMLAVIGANSVWLGRRQSRVWHSIQNHSVSGSIPVTLSRLLQQERLRMPEDSEPPVVCASGFLSDRTLRERLEADGIRVTGAPEWPGQDCDWAERHRLALSPVWPVCA